jgi:hypothetical protein
MLPAFDSHFSNYMHTLSYVTQKPSISKYNILLHKKVRLLMRSCIHNDLVGIAVSERRSSFRPRPKLKLCSITTRLLAENLSTSIRRIPHGLPTEKPKRICEEMPARLDDQPDYLAEKRFKPNPRFRPIKITGTLANHIPSASALN